MEDIIREIFDEDQIRVSAAVVRESFKTVAREFNLTKENCPTHPSLVTFDQLMGLHRKGLRFFGLFVDMAQFGFVAVERGDDTVYYMEKLAVLPQARHQGYGEQLVRFTVDYAAKQGAGKLSIGTIHEHTVLKEWYKSLGFVETGTKKFDHLPFTVCFMEKEIPGNKTI
jgi:ribosomal protein S18 acetylase RimI-like enzyme